MKVAILVTGFVPNILGGTEIATYHIARHLARRGYDIHVITQRENHLPKESMLDDFYVHRCRVIQKRFLWFTSYALHVFHIIRRFKPNLIHVKGISLALVALPVRKIYRIPYIVWAQGMDVYSPQIFARPFHRAILANANAIIAQTDDEKRAIQKICNKKNLNTYIIPNGIDIERFNRQTKEEAREKLTISRDERIILFVGGLREVKGVKYLIQAMKTVVQKESRLRLILVGDGKERPYLKKLTQNLDLVGFVHFQGQQDNDKVLEYMAAADIFILPSLSEGFPVVIVEAMASGLPIITTSVRGLPEIVKDGENGLIVEPKNASDIAAKILLLLKHGEVRERMALANRQTANNYTWENIVDILEQVYRTATSRGPM